MNKNILFLTTKYPFPPDDGGKIDSLTNLHILAKNFNVFLFYIGKKQNEEVFQKKGIHLCGIYHYQKEKGNNIFGLFKNIFCRMPYTIKKYHDDKIYIEIEKIIKEKKIDITYADHLHMAFYGKLINKHFPEIKLILREHNAEYIFWKRIYKEENNIFKKLLFWWQFLKILNYEREITSIFDKCFMISSIDQMNLKKINPYVRAQVISTGINIQNYQIFQLGKIIPFSMLYVGDFSWLPNLKGIVWFLTKVWPETKKLFPKAKIFIVGKKPPKDILRYQNNDIIVTGYVKDVKPWIDKSEIFLVPLFSGGGIRIKILEAMAKGKPIVSTPVGAEGIDVENKKNILIAGNKEDFVKSIKILFDNKEIRENLAKNSIKLIRNKYSFKAIERNICSIIKDL